MSELDIGVFIEFWNGHPNHMPFLGLYEDDDQPKEWNLNKSLRQLDYVCDKSSYSEVQESILKALNNENWRPQLIAILASFKLKEDDQRKLIPNLWTRLGKGSWISPQILSALSIIDTEFEIKANIILQNGFEIGFSKMNPLESHSARGPESNSDAVEKVISSIEALLGKKGGELNWKGNLLQLIEKKRLSRY